MIQIFKKKYKEHSHQTIEEIKRQQGIHFKDLIQPRYSDGNLNLEFLNIYGCKNITITEHDIKYVERFGRKFIQRVIDKFKQQNASSKNN